jgi:quercetin dioxygenase-like cupin family protein
MNVFRAGSSGTPDSKTVEGFFRGEARLTGMATADSTSVRMNRVSFAPGACTVWHSHEGGQLLIVVEGSGTVGTRDSVAVVGVGDAVWTAAGEEHWHGADSESLVHIAVSLGQTSWERE